MLPPSMITCLRIFYQDTSTPLSPCTPSGGPTGGSRRTPALPRGCASRLAWAAAPLALVGW
eukprot:scaffold12360_cov109-Isochrysis_galbana.AAC.12